MNDNYVILENISKKFKDQTALYPLNLKFEQGKIHGLIGRNGSGKTVLLKIICGLMHPSSGSCTINGKIIGKDLDFPKKTGILIEKPGFISGYSGYKNLRMLYGINKSPDKECIYNAMHQVGLDPTLKRAVQKYSLGMKQRLGIAQAIMEEPSLLILDEPMNGLDKQGLNDMGNLFMDLRSKGVTIIMSSHYHEEVARICDTTLELESGKVSS